MPPQHTFRPPRRWNARWIWAADNPQARNSYWLFRRELILNDLPAGARLFLSADTRYQLYINGRFIGRGVPQSAPYLQYYDEREVSSDLREGRNCIGVIVNYVGNIPDTRGGLLLEMTDESHETILRTDQTWRVVQSNAWKQDTHMYGSNQRTPYQEMHDGRRLPDSWNQPGFDDSTWEAASIVSGRISPRPPAAGPWSRLVPRDIPFMTDKAVHPERLESVEECVDLANRARPADLTVGLSTGGKPVEHTLVQNAQDLCSDEGSTTFQCSTKHQDGFFDGIYDPCVVLDFGRVITAYPRIELEGVAGGMIDIGYAERLVDGRFNNAIEGQFADRYTMKEGRQVYQPFTWKAFRYLKIRLRRCQKPVRVRSLQGVVSTYPYEERGDFESSDQQLNSVWEISRRTIRLCSNEFLMDTPWREQAQWLGDVAAVTLGGIYSCFGDTRLPGKFIRQSGGNQLPSGLLSNISNTAAGGWQGCIPDYSLWWVMGLWNHYLYTGETRWINRFYPVALRILQTHMQYVNEHGLIEDMPYWVFIDWADVDRRGECTALNAIFHGALEAGRKLAGERGDARAARDFRAARTKLAVNFQDRLYDPNRGCFADACVDGAFSQKTSEHASMAAIRWGLCDGKTRDEIIRQFYVDKTIEHTEAQPFFTSVVLQALDRSGRFDLALEVIRQRWGRRMVDRGATSTFEEWGTNGSWRGGEYRGFMRTLSHAWSAHPAEFLIRNLAGIEILEPGCTEVRISPKQVDFDYDVTFPTPRGPIRVNHGGGQEISLPDGVTRKT